MCGSEKDCHTKEREQDSDPQGFPLQVHTQPIIIVS